MSYEIIYDVMGIKSPYEDKYVIVFISGSNNCWEPTSNGGERRERYLTANYLLPWEKRFTPLTEKEMMEALEEEALRRYQNYIKSYEEEKDMTFEEYCSQLGYHWGIDIKKKKNGIRAFKNLLKKGIRQSATPSQLEEEGYVVSITFKENTVYVRDENFNEAFKEAISNSRNYQHISVGSVWDEYDMRMLKKRLGLLQQKIKSNSNIPKNCYIEFFKDGYFQGYFRKRTSRNLIYSSIPTYFSEKNAKAKLKKLNEIGRYNNWSFAIKYKEEEEVVV